MNNKILEAALEYAAKGVAIFPCKPDKAPHTRQGFKDATTDSDQIVSWWRKWPSAMIGMPTGKANGFDVLDLDVKDGKRGLELVPEWKELSPLIARTRSGGVHVYFSADGVRCSTNVMGKDSGVDVRGDGGYVILPPSPGYEWVEGKLP
jgi:hypothetical protein